jgi:protein-S-isoprenylcysteine O-methyltransferase Ste14
MRFDYTQVFLLAWMVAFWVYYFSTYGKVEEKHERANREKYGIQAKWGPFFGLAFLGWTAVILIYFFHYDSIDWIWKLSFLDRTPVKLIAIIMMCFAFLLNILFTVSVGKSIQDALALGEGPKLVTTGVYGYIRHPGYLAFFAVAFGSFLIIPNLITLVLLAYTCVVIYGHTLEEEKKLLKVFGEAYEQYQSEVGRFLPKLKRKGE